MGILSSWLTKMKTEPGKAWAYGALVFAIVGSILVSGLRYLGEDKYYQLILLADLVWMGAVGICLWIAIWRVYENREMRHRKRNLWMGAVAVLVATAATFCVWYRFSHDIL